MTVVAHPISIHRFIGLSSDTKPTIAAPLGMAPPTIGSTFYEYDTGELWITYDGTTWVTKDFGRMRSWLFGQPELRADNHGRATWDRGTIYQQKGTSGWQVKLAGGTQTGDDWGACYVPVNELPVTGFTSAQWTYYLTNAEVYGLNIVIWIHDPNDISKRAEVTQSGSSSNLAHAEDWNIHIFDTSDVDMFYFGENVGSPGLDAGPSHLYSWSQFQADAVFSTWTIYRISIEYGWYSTGIFESAWLCDLLLNGEMILLKPSLAYETRLIKPTTYSHGIWPVYATGTSGTLLGHEGYIYWVSVWSRNNVRSVITLLDSSSVVWGTGLTGTQYDHAMQTFVPPIHCAVNISYTQGSMGYLTAGITWGDLLEDGSYSSASD